MCAAASLAFYAPDDPRWNAAAPKVAAVLTRMSPFFVKDWTEALTGVKDQLVGPLAAIASDPAGTPRNGSWQPIFLSLAPDQPDVLTRVLIGGTEEQFAVVFPLLMRLGPAPLGLLEAELDRPMSDDATDPQNELIARHKAVAAVALVRLGRPEKVWPLFRTARDERVRSYLIHWSRPLGVDLQAITPRWEKETDFGREAGLRCCWANSRTRTGLKVSKSG